MSGLVTTRDLEKALADQKAEILEDLGKKKHHGVPGWTDGVCWEATGQAADYNQGQSQLGAT